MRPAWSDAFGLDLAPAPSLEVPAITREWAFGSATSKGVKVAVIDSGIDPTHPTIGSIDGAVAFVPDAEAPDGVRTEEGPHADLYGHGTACAGIIRSIAPDVELWSLRVLGESLTGKASSFAAALDWAIINGFNVVNLSLSTANENWFAAFHELCDQAVFARTMVVCALANEKKNSFPSEYSSVFSVAATDAQDPDVWCCNPKAPAEWGARGIDLDVAWLDGATLNVTGNSFAAPHIAGHLARLIEMHPTITVWQAKTVLAELASNGAVDPSP